MPSDLSRAEWEWGRRKEARETHEYSLVQLGYCWPVLFSFWCLSGLSHKTISFPVLYRDSPRWAGVRIFFFWTNQTRNLKGERDRDGEKRERERRRGGEGDKKAGDNIIIRWCFFKKELPLVAVWEQTGELFLKIRIRRGFLSQGYQMLDDWGNALILVS